MKVGDTIWYFDVNRRVYPKPGEGCLYAEHWREVEIKSETSRSWVTNRGKVSKKGQRGWAFTRQEVDDDIYIYDNQYLLSERIKNCQNPGVMRAIKELLDKEDGK